MQSHRNNYNEQTGGHYVPTLKTCPQAITKYELNGKSTRPMQQVKVAKERSRKSSKNSTSRRGDKSKTRKSSSGSKKSTSERDLMTPFPILQLPRVELWCRNPQCTYNKSHPKNSAAIDPATYGNSRINLPNPRRSQQSKVSISSSTSTPFASDSNTTDTTLTIKSSSSESVSRIEGPKVTKYPGVHEFFPGVSRRVPPPPKQVTAQNPVIASRFSFSRPKQGSNRYMYSAKSSGDSCAGCKNSRQNRFDEENPDENRQLDDSYAAFWHLSNNYANFQSTLKRDASVHSYGGFTLNGHPGHSSVKKKSWQRFCSSHKIALVVSTFSLIVTVGLVITLLLMKKRGMMEAMR